MPYQRFNLFTRMISIFLLFTFVSQDIVWAYPSDKLAPQSIVRTDDYKTRSLAVAIIYLIEHNAQILRQNLTVAGIAAILRENAEWLTGNNIMHQVSVNNSEISIALPRGHILRYFDPKLAKPEDFGYQGSEGIEDLGTVHKQLLMATLLPVQQTVITKKIPVAVVKVQGDDRYRNRLRILYKYANKKRTPFVLKIIASSFKKLDALDWRSYELSKRATNEERMEFIELNVNEVLLRLQAMLGSDGALEKRVTLSRRLEDTIIASLKEFQRRGKYKPKDMRFPGTEFNRLRQYAAMLFSVSSMRPDGRGGFIDLKPDHSVANSARKELFRVAERIIAIDGQSALLDRQMVLKSNPFAAPRHMEKIVPEVVAYEDFAAVSARKVADAIRDYQAITSMDINLFLTRGDTMIGFMRRLASEPRIDWARVQIFQSTSYAGISPRSAFSFKSFIKEYFIDHLAVKDLAKMTKIHYVNESNVEAYKDLARNTFGPSIVVLGIGRNGRIALNEPGAYFESQSRIDEVSPETIRDVMQDVPPLRLMMANGKMPRAYTMGMYDIAQAGKVFLLASGGEKQEIVHAALEGPVTARVPASMLQKISDRTVVILDEEAASGLSSDSNKSSPMLEKFIEIARTALHDAGFELNLSDLMKQELYRKLATGYIDLIVTEDELRKILGTFDESERSISDSLSMEKFERTLQSKIMNFFLAHGVEKTLEISSADRDYQHVHETYKLISKFIHIFKFKYISDRREDRKTILKTFIIANIRPSDSKIGSNIRSEVSMRLMVDEIFMNRDPEISEFAIEVVLDCCSDEKYGRYFTAQLLPFLRESENLPRFGIGILNVLINVDRNPNYFAHIENKEMFLVFAANIIKALVLEDLRKGRHYFTRKLIEYMYANITNNERLNPFTLELYKEIEDNFAQHVIDEGGAQENGTIQSAPQGLIVPVWAMTIKFLRRLGVPDRSIAMLGGFEEIFFSGVMVSGAASILSYITGCNPVVGLIAGSLGSFGLFISAHAREVMRIDHRTRRLAVGAASGDDIKALARAGFFFRAIYFTLMVMPFGSVSALVAVAVTGIAHSMYNLFATYRALPVAMVDSGDNEDADEKDVIVSEAAVVKMDVKETLKVNGALSPVVVQREAQTLSRAATSPGKGGFTLLENELYDMAKKNLGVSFSPKDAEAALALAAEIDAADPYTLHHSKNVASYSVAIARELARLAPALQELANFEKFKEELKMSSLLHDLGKIEVPLSVLNKSGALNPEERTVIEKHPDAGARILAPLEELRDSIPGIRSHHERFDGSGYPSGLKGNEIPLGGRIIAVADTFDAMTTTRSYQKAKPVEEAIAELKNNAGILYDPIVVEAFVRSYDSGAIRLAPQNEVIQTNADNIRTLSALHLLFQTNLKAAPFADGTKIMLSENLFIKDGDDNELLQIRLALAPLVRSGVITIAAPDMLRRAATNQNAAKEKLAIVLTREDFEDKEIWGGTDKETALRSSVLILDDTLAGKNYLYLEGVLGLARSIMANNKQAIRAYYELISGVVIPDDVLGLLTDDSINNIGFAVRAILKFRPIVKFDGAEFDKARISMENALISA